FSGAAGPPVTLVEGVSVNRDRLTGRLDRGGGDAQRDMGLLRMPRDGATSRLHPCRSTVSELRPALPLPLAQPPHAPEAPGEGMAGIARRHSAGGHCKSGAPAAAPTPAEA